MNLTVLKNPIVLLALTGCVFITNLVTYNVASPASDHCNAGLNAISQRQTQDQADLQRALRNTQKLNDNRSGGLNWKESVR